MAHANITMAEGGRMLFIISLFLSTAVLAVESAASSGRAMFSANSNAPTPAVTTSANQEVIQWVQITAVPLGVFLLGACIWDIIQNTAANLGNVFHEFGEGLSTANHPAFTENHLISDNLNAQDLEDGLQLQHLGTDDGLAATPPDSPHDARDGMQCEVDVSNNDEVASVSAATMLQQR